jgi:hypothetical protein
MSAHTLVRDLACQETSMYDNLAVESALVHIGVPVLLASSPARVPQHGTLRGTRSLALHVHFTADEPTALLRRIQTCLAPLTSPTINRLRVS